jgi:predicted O-methyltransferase YrrM
MTEYQFTKDWFQWAPEVWTQLIPMLPERKSFLEIGSFEGRSSIWIIENMMNPGDWIDCVDTWEGGEEHSEEDMGSVEKRFKYNVNLALGGAVVEERDAEHKFPYPVHTRYASPAPTEGQRKRLYKYKCTSTQYLGSKLASCVDNKNLFDFIYIDGSHVAKDVLTDACMAWPLLKPKGLMVFDDYLWSPSARDILHRPKAAIDAFTNLFAEEVEIVHVGYQLVVRKKGE